MYRLVLERRVRRFEDCRDIRFDLCRSLLRDCPRVVHDQASTLNALILLDSCRDAFEVIGHLLGPPIRGLVKEDPFDVDSVMGRRTRPSRVYLDIVEDVLDLASAVIRPYVTDGRDVVFGIQPGYFVRITGIGTRWISGPAVWVDDDDELDLRISIETGSQRNR